MVVRYVGAGAPLLVAGGEYVVLAVEAFPGSSRPLMFQLHLPERSITDWALYEADQFEVVDGSLPTNWKYTASDGGFRLEPAAWARVGHGDDLFADDRDRVELAWASHRVERDQILREAGRPPGREGSIGRICKPPERATRQSS